MTQTHTNEHNELSQGGPELADIIPGLVRPETALHAVDVGCGTGDDVRWLCEAGFEAIGIDANADVLQIAASKTSPDMVVSWIVGDAIALPLDDRSCVLVTDRGCLHHLSSEQQRIYAAEVSRVLMPGGAWVIRDVIGHSHQIAQLGVDEVAGLAQHAALRVEDLKILKDLYPHTWLVAVLRRD